MPGSFLVVRNWIIEASLDIQLYGHDTVAIIFLLQPRPFFKFQSPFNTVMGQDSLICDNVCLWGGFKKGNDSIDNIDIGLGKILEGVGTNKQVYPFHGEPIQSSIIVVDGGRIM